MKVDVSLGNLVGTFPGKYHHAVRVISYVFTDEVHSWKREGVLRRSGQCVVSRLISCGPTNGLLRSPISPIYGHLITFCFSMSENNDCFYIFICFVYEFDVKPF